MRNLWNPKEAKLFSKSKLQHRVSELSVDRGNYIIVIFILDDL